MIKNRNNPLEGLAAILRLMQIAGNETTNFDDLVEEIYKDKVLDSMPELGATFTFLLSCPLMKDDVKAEEFARRYALLELDMMNELGFELKNDSKEGRAQAIKERVELCLEKRTKMFEEAKKESEEKMKDEVISELVDKFVENLRSSSHHVEVREFNFKDLLNL